MVNEFLIYLQRRHPDIHIGLKKKTTTASTSEETGQTTLTPYISSIDTKWKPTNPQMLRLTSHLVSFIANDLLPLSLVESIAFR